MTAKQREHWTIWKLKYKFTRPWYKCQYLLSINYSLINGYKFSNN